MLGLMRRPMSFPCLGTLAGSPGLNQLCSHVLLTPVPEQRPLGHLPASQVSKLIAKPSHPPFYMAERDNPPPTRGRCPNPLRPPSSFPPAVTQAPKDSARVLILCHHLIVPSLRETPFGMLPPSCLHILPQLSSSHSSHPSLPSLVPTGQPSPSLKGNQSSKTRRDFGLLQ